MAAISSANLIAREVHYHKSCYHSCTYADTLARIVASRQKTHIADHTASSNSSEDDFFSAVGSELLDDCVQGRSQDSDQGGFLDVPTQKSMPSLWSFHVGRYYILLLHRQKNVQLLFRNSEFHELNQSDQTNIDTDLGLRVLLILSPLRLPHSWYISVLSGQGQYQSSSDDRFSS